MHAGRVMQDYITKEIGCVDNFWAWRRSDIKERLARIALLASLALARADRDERVAGVAPMLAAFVIAAQAAARVDEGDECNVVIEFARALLSAEFGAFMAAQEHKHR